ncbi:MAG: 6,7-dimethyl-8-ribityllumazine synthase [Actinobacteria bacterium]|uniref:6,7-dimethyl-8-ribityllumazine synthase n=1 Tax=freshwater metagenome TaxID=449393 RepID=A0A6J7CNU9_9ZZZZ|nr:6,7-dimethyl-8-ribityllumazine synthase [Actinomycetota bacterium]
MSGAGAPTGGIDAPGVRVAVIAASWHEVVMTGLLDGAVRACGESRAEATVMRVSGAFELPLLAKACAVSGRFDAVVALGVIIRGGTPHFEYVCDAATSGLAQVALDTMVPVGFGLLTCDNEQQALDRAGLPGAVEDKGAEATWAALTSVAALRALQASVQA